MFPLFDGKAASLTRQRGGILDSVLCSALNAAGSVYLSADDARMSDCDRAASRDQNDRIKLSLARHDLRMYDASLIYWIFVRSVELDVR